MPYFVARHVPLFMKQYPEVDLQLVEHTTSRLIDALQAGDVDLAVASLPLSNPDLVCSELFRERIVLALPPEHPLATLEEVELTKIRNERLLFLREGHCFRESALTACRKGPDRRERRF